MIHPMLSNDSAWELTPSLHQILEDRGEVVVRRRHLADDAELAAGGELGEPCVEQIRLPGLDDDRALVEFEAADIREAEELAGQGPWIVGAHGHRVRMLVDEIADVVHVSFR